MAIRLYELDNLTEDEFVQFMFESFTDFVNIDYESRMIENALEQRPEMERERINEKFHDLIFDKMKEYNNQKRERN